MYPKRIKRRVCGTSSPERRYRPSVHVQLMQISGLSLINGPELQQRDLRFLYYETSFPPRKQGMEILHLTSRWGIIGFATRVSANTCFHIVPRPPHPGTSGHGNPKVLSVHENSSGVLQVLRASQISLDTSRVTC